MGSTASRTLGLLGLLVLAGCAERIDAPQPPARAAPSATAPAPRPPEPARSAESEALAQHYRRLQNDLVAQGLLRQDGGGTDVPFSEVMLSRNFLRIALFDEYAELEGDLRARTTPALLRRWEGPVRMKVEFGETVPRPQRERDRNSIRDYAARLSALTGLAIVQSDRDPNFHVLFLNEPERRAAGARLRALVPGISDASVRAVTNLPRSQLCLVIAFSEGGSSTYSRAVALVRGEHPDLLRLSCIHEEIAQGLGLANDSPFARPSIFNDDEEFALLTGHDELLLRMLYDPRLRPGMTEAEAAPVARRIAAELLGGPS